MQKNPQNFDMQRAMQLAKSPAGQQLLNLLQQGDKNQLNQAKSQANNGDYAAALATVKQMLSTEEGQALLKKLGG